MADPDTDLPPSMTRLAFHGPLSEARAARLVARLTAAKPATILDVGCGWGELMLRILAARPDATGTGLDTDEGDLIRGRGHAQARGLAERVAFIRESAVGTARGPADLVLCTGSSHTLSDAEPPGHTAAALRALRRLVTPGGRVLLGEGFWERPPAETELAAMWPGTSAGEQFDLPGLVDVAIDAGFRPAWIEVARRNGTTSNRATSAMRRSGWRPTATTPRPPRSGRKSTSTGLTTCAATAEYSAWPTSPWSRPSENQLDRRRTG
jgi:SAM-dependent methyltransferase